MKVLRFILLPVSLLYAAVVLVRNFLYDIGVFSSQRYTFPLINVGNLAAGGTGKSPHVEYLLKLLSKDYRFTSLSRGYGRKTSGFAEVLSESTFVECGDEPVMIKSNYPEVPIFVDGNRRRGLREIFKKYSETQGVILDDAFQHRSVTPGLNILLTDYSRLYIQDFVLPTGYLREPRRGANRADIIVVTKCPDIFSPVDARAIRKRLKVKPYQSVYFSYIKYGALKPVYSSLPPFEGKLNAQLSVLLFTGIAKPGNLYYKIKNSVKEVEHLRFSDHHAFGMSDINRIVSGYEGLKGERKIILTTEKDSIRMQLPGIREILESYPIYYLPIEVTFHGKDQQEFDERIINYVERNIQYS
ncbi:tetraacyldisaccharide 4'-kinase [bacterium SCSIO 12741]|nr:tetraacyldisaccharide 4'-kinase [bacterium SCSIO 12741]